MVCVPDLPRRCSNHSRLGCRAAIPFCCRPRTSRWHGLGYQMDHGRKGSNRVLLHGAGYAHRRYLYLFSILNQNSAGVVQQLGETPVAMNTLVSTCIMRRSLNPHMRLPHLGNRHSHLCDCLVEEGAARKDHCTRGRRLVSTSTPCPLI